MATSERNDRQSARAAGPVSSGTADPWSAQARHQLECGMLAWVAVLESAEALHRFLLDTTHRARKRHETIGSRVHAAADIETMAALQQELWRLDTDAATRYGEELTDVLTHMGAEVLDQVEQAAERWVDDSQRTAAMLMPATLGSGVDWPRGLWGGGRAPGLARAGAVAV